MMITLLPLVSLATVVPAPVSEVVASPRVAQVRLAETLAEAEAIEAVRARGRTVTFAIVRDGEAFDVIATTRKAGEVIALTIAPAALTARLHGLTWLGAELAEATAVTTLAVDVDGAVLIRTSHGRRYLAIPGRGSGGAGGAGGARR